MQLSLDQKKRLVLGIIIAGCVLILLWVFFLNRGTLVIIAEPPYTLEVTGAPDKTCIENPCRTRIIRGTYQIKLSKEAYFPHEQNIEIKMLKETPIEINFVIIPKAEPFQEYHPLTLPQSSTSIASNIAQISLFHNKDTDWTRLPKTAQKINFSPRALKAAVFTERNQFLYEVKTGTLANPPFTPLENYAWLPDESGMIYLAKNPDERFQGLYLYQFEKSANELIVFFKNEITSALISVAPNQRHIILSDNASNSLYLIDGNKKIRQKLNFDKKIIAVVWSLDSLKLALITGTTIGPNLFVYDLDAGKFLAINATVQHQKIVFSAAGKLIMALPHNKVISLQNSVTSTIISLPQQTDTSQGKERIIEFDSAAQRAEIILASTPELPLHPEKIEIADDGKSIFFLQEGIIYKIQR